MKPKNIEDIFKKRKKKKKKGDEFDIEGSDYPVHEKYTKEELAKK